MTDVDLRELVVGEVERRDPRALDRAQQRVLLGAVAHAQADEHVGLGRVGVAVVELRDVAAAEEAAERLEAAGPLRDRRREDRLPCLAEVGALGDEAQPVEVHVRAAEHGDEVPAGHPLSVDVTLRARDAERGRRLHDRSRVLEDVLHRRAELVGVDEDHLVDVPPCEPKRLDADLLHRHAVGEEPDVWERDPAARAEGAIHRVRIGRLDTDDADLRPQPLHVRGDPADQPAAADGDEDRVDRLAQLPQDLHADRPLARDHVRVVVGVDERQLASAADAHRLGVGVVVRVALEDDRRPESGDGVDLDLRCRHRHHDRGLGPEALRGERHALGVVARGGGDDAPAEVRSRKAGHLVVRPAELEREDGLEILALQQQAVAEPGREKRRLVQRRLDGDVVDVRVEDRLQVVAFGCGAGHWSPIVRQADRTARQGGATSKST